MSTQKTRDEIIKHKKSSIKIYNQMLERFLNSNSADDLKKVDNLSYWLETYSKYILEEKTFNPKKLLNYKRGDVVRANFGFRIGNELGGLHFATVLNANSKQSAGCITVVPLSSTDGKEVPHYNVDLGSELYKKIEDNTTKLLDQITEKEKTITGILDLLTESIKVLTSESPNLKPEQSTEKLYPIFEKFEEVKKQAEELNKTRELLMQHLREIEHLKSGSMAITNQIVTISKQRIYVPKKSKDFLYGISLSPNAMEKISEKLHELYFLE